MLHVSSSCEMAELSSPPIFLDCRRVVAQFRSGHGLIPVLFDGQVLATARLEGESALAPNGHLSLFVDQILWSEGIDFSDFMGPTTTRRL